MIDNDTSTIGPLSNNHARFGAAALMVTAMIHNSPARTDNMANAESTKGVLVAADRTIVQLHAAIRQGARTLSASVDEESETGLDEFLASTAPPVRKTKLVRR